jgi:putative membrane protein
MSFLEPALQVARGFAMGAADIVPGVSGGTVALVLGIYERLVDNIHRAASVLSSVVRGDLRQAAGRLREVEWVWVISLLAGIGVAVLALSSVIEHLLEEHAQSMAGLFCGLILGSVAISWRLAKAVTWANVVVMLAAAVVFFLFLGLKADTEATGAELVTKPLWAFFLAGAVAICAMILPGISGSFILVLLGMYTEVLGAVNERDVVVLAVFVLGCAIGLASFSTGLSWALDRHHDRVLALMIGLMLGSLRVLWPWPNGVASTRLEAPRAGEPVLLPVVLAIAGFVVVVGVEVVNARLRHRRQHDLGGARAEGATP